MREYSGEEECSENLNQIGVLRAAPGKTVLSALESALMGAKRSPASLAARFQLGTTSSTGPGAAAAARRASQDRAVAKLRARADRIAHVRSSSSYAVMLLDEWTDKSVISMVGRFRYGRGFIDVIYLPAQNPTAGGWAQAVRALERDRRTNLRSSDRQRVLRITGNGTVRVTRGRGEALSSTDFSLGRPLPRATMTTLESSFRTRLLPELREAPSRATRTGTVARMLREPGK